MSRFVSRFSMVSATLGLALMATLAVTPLACSGDGGGGGEGGSEPVCEGGIFDDQGNCVAVCDPAKCLEGNVCAGNACRLLCSSHEECYRGTQQCTTMVEDTSGRTVQVCTESGHQPSLNEGGWPVGTYGEPCLFGDADCAFQTACPNGLECNFTAACQAGTCEPDAVACGDLTLCNIGRCSESGERCIFNTCTQDQCTPFVCIGVGEGDADAYCTHRDCSDDTQCAPGFYCGVTLDPHDVCGPTCAGTSCAGGPNDGGSCNDDGDCQKGNSNYCGTTPDTFCIDPVADNGGAQYVESPLCLLRRTCLKRAGCSPCNENLDCSLGSDVCQNHLGANVCAKLCDSPDDCTPDEYCVGYVAASGKSMTCGSTPTVDCAVPEDCPTAGDTCLPRSVCVPASGKCDASDAPGDKFCYHCVDDRDCGPLDSTMACVEVDSNMKACFDLAFPVTCTVDADCPTSPSGLHGECLDEAEGLSPGDSVYHRCYFPFNNFKQKFTCY